MDKPFCPDCEKPTEVIMDHAAGDTVCVDCGLVLEAHSVDESSEWRTFSGEQSGADPNRVGDPTNPLLTDKGLTTMISKGNGKGSDMAVLGRWQNRGSNSDRNLLAAFGSIATMADRLGLVGTIKRRFCSHLGMNNQATRAAIETVKSIEALDIRKSPISVAAAAIYMISQISDAKLTLKAISDVAGVAEVTIRNSYKELFPHARKLLPEWFVKEEQFKNLSAF